MLFLNLKNLIKTGHRARKKQKILNIQPSEAAIDLYSQGRQSPLMSSGLFCRQGGGNPTASEGVIVVILTVSVVSTTGQVR